MVGVRCDAAVSEKPAGEEETAGEKFEYQAEVSYRIREFGIGVHELSLVCCIHSFSMPLHFAVGCGQIRVSRLTEFCLSSWNLQLNASVFM